MSYQKKDGQRLRTLGTFSRNAAHLQLLIFIIIFWRRRRRRRKRRRRKRRRRTMWKCGIKPFMVTLIN